MASEVVTDVARRTAGRRPVEVLVAGDGHAEELAAFFRATWDSMATPDSVRQARSEGARTNTAEPGRTPPSIIALQGGRIIGFVATLPVRLWSGSSDLPAYCLHGLMVPPEFRNGPIGYLVLKEATHQLPRTLGHVVSPQALRLFSALGFRDLGAVPNYVRPLSTKRLLTHLDPSRLGEIASRASVQSALRVMRQTGTAALAGGATDLAIHAWEAATDLTTRGATTAVSSPIALVHELESLWRAARPALAAAIVRDSAYLTRRYPQAALGGRYHWVAVHRGHELAGVAILREPRIASDARLSGLRVSVLADLVLRPGDAAAARALVGGAVRQARKLGADVLLASASPTVAAALRGHLFLRLTGTVHVLVRDASPDRTSWPQDLAGWWVTRGDGEADLAF